MSSDYDEAEHTTTPTRKPQEVAYEEIARSFCVVLGTKYDFGYHFANDFYFCMQGGNSVYRVEITRDGNMRTRGLQIEQCGNVPSPAVHGLMQAAQRDPNFPRFASA